MKKNIICIFILVSVMLFGCSQENIKNEKLDTVSSVDGDIVERSEKISDIVVELYGIDDSTTIILENTAIIGVKVAYEQKLTKDIRSTIEKTVLDEAVGINKVLITDKAALFSEIDSIITEILQGESYEDQLDDIKKIKTKLL